MAKHINHYLHDNGRFIVHVLVTIFLALPKAMWRTVNSLLLGLFVYFGSRVILRNSNALLQNITCLVLLCSGVLALDISITRESVYWLTGSLNYVYPIVLLMFYWYLLERKGNKTLIAVTAFLSAATTEQNAMMTAGLSFLYLTHNIRQKRNKESLVTGFISSIAGMCTVLLSPSVLARYSLENKKAIPLADLLRSNIKLQWVNFFSAEHTILYQLIFIVISCLFILSCKSMLTRKERIFAGALSGFAIAEIALIDMLSKQQSNVMTPDKLLCISIISVYYIILVSFSMYILFRHKPMDNYYIPLFALALCFGSQLMMIVSPVWGPRNALCGILMLSLCSSFYAAHINLPDGMGIMSAALIFICVAVSVVSVSNVSETAMGYAENMQVERANITLIRQYKDNGGIAELCQYKLIDDDYGWSMPYYSPYHEVYYKMRYDLPQELNIQWIDYK